MFDVVEPMNAPPVPTELIIEVAANRSALVEATAEYARRMFIEYGADWEGYVTRISIDAKSRAMQMISDELRQKQGYRPPEVKR